MKGKFLKWAFNGKCFDMFCSREVIEVEQNGTYDATPHSLASPPGNIAAGFIRQFHRTSDDDNTYDNNHHHNNLDRQCILNDDKNNEFNEHKTPPNTLELPIAPTRVDVTIASTPTSTSQLHRPLMSQSRRIPIQHTSNDDD